MAETVQELIKELCENAKLFREAGRHGMADSMALAAGALARQEMEIKELRERAHDLSVKYTVALRERDEVRAENTRLRAALAHSDQPCAYCTLPAADWARCESGFPGCGRADDAMGCPELGASLHVAEAIRERDEAQARIGELTAALECVVAGLTEAGIEILPRKHACAVEVAALRDLLPRAAIQGEAAPQSKNADLTLSKDVV